MATITRPTLTDAVSQSFAPVELTGTDTLSVKTGTLFVFNASASPANIVIDGDEATTTTTKTAGVVNVAGGYTVACPAGQVTEVNLGTISAFLAGDVAVTGGTADMFAWVQ